MARCKSTISFDGGSDLVQCAREEHGIAQPPADRMSYHWDLSETRRWSTYPDEVLASFHVEKPADERVDHPHHYNAHPSGVECITIAEHMGFNVGNAIKYLWRADEKGAPLDDLRKAEWYIKREIDRRSK